eukprot:m.9753 g.9753  ORF g.9753 m.9753 type:complete len:533 (-) comp2671_c0_seq2:285-1883(-)
MKYIYTSFLPPCIRTQSIKCELTVVYTTVALGGVGVGVLLDGMAVCGWTLLQMSDHSDSTERRTCIACRSSKVKCDLNTPCGRCSRLDIVCEPTPPSRRGLPGQRQRKRRKVQANNTVESYVAGPRVASDEHILVTSSTEGLLPCPKNPSCQPHAGLLQLAQSWISIGSSRRSCELISKAFALAARGNISLDDLLDAQGDGVTPGGSFTFLAPILFSPKDKHRSIIGPPLSATDFPADVCRMVGSSHQDMISGKGKWTHCRMFDMGQLRFWGSPSFERDIVTTAVVNETFIKNEFPVFNLFIPEKERPRLLHAMGSQFRLYESRDKPPPPTGLRTKILRRDGREVDVDMLLTVRILSPGRSMAISTFCEVKCDPTTSTDIKPNPRSLSSRKTGQAQHGDGGVGGGGLKTENGNASTALPPFPGSAAAASAAALVTTSAAPASYIEDLPPLDIGPPLEGGGGGGVMGNNGDAAPAAVTPSLPPIPLSPVDAGATWQPDLADGVDLDLAFLLGLGMEEWGDILKDDKGSGASVA